MTCRICNHPARETNYAAIDHMWNDLNGYRAGPTLGAYDAFSYAITIRRFMGAMAPYPCHMCVPGAPPAPPPPEPSRVQDRRRERPPEQDGVDALLREGLKKIHKPLTGNMIEDLSFSLSQQTKLHAACLRESFDPLRKCHADMSYKGAAIKTGAALVVGAFKGVPPTLKVAAVDATAMTAWEAAKHETCKDAAKQLLGDECIRRTMPKGFIHISTTLKNNNGDSK